MFHGFWIYGSYVWDRHKRNWFFCSKLANAGRGVYSSSVSRYHKRENEDLGTTCFHNPVTTLGIVVTSKNLLILTHMDLLVLIYLHILPDAYLEAKERGV